jgi:C4-dicarboxylate-specific signal transduction histidine kinase
MLHEILTWALDVYRMQSQIQEMQLKLIEVERLSTIGTLMASIAHDIKNPIGYISAYVETLDQCTHAFSDWVTALRGNSSLNGAFKLPQATKSRRNSGAPTPAEPAVAVEYARKLVTGTVSARGGALQIEIWPQPLPLVTMATPELSQVLINLLTNAAHALDGTPREREVRLKARPAAGGVEFQVIDTGMGMPAEVEEHCFDQFFTTKAPGVGTGLGLAICKRLVEGAPAPAR